MEKLTIPWSLKNSSSAWRSQNSVKLSNNQAQEVVTHWHGNLTNDNEGSGNHICANRVLILTAVKRVMVKNERVNGVNSA